MIRKGKIFRANTKHQYALGLYNRNYFCSCIERLAGYFPSFQISVVLILNENTIIDYEDGAINSKTQRETIAAE